MIPLANAHSAHVADLVAKPCTDELAAVLERQISDTLHVLVHPVVDPFGVVNLWPEGIVPIEAEVKAMKAFRDATDSPLAWRAPASEVIWTAS